MYLTVYTIPFTKVAFLIILTVLQFTVLASHKLLLASLGHSNFQGQCYTGTLTLTHTVRNFGQIFPAQSWKCSFNLAKFKRYKLRGYCESLTLHKHLPWTLSYDWPISKDYISNLNWWYEFSYIKISTYSISISMKHFITRTICHYAAQNYPSYRIAAKFKK